jgi:hypothetical protein
MSMRNLDQPEAGAVHQTRSKVFGWRGQFTPEFGVALKRSASVSSGPAAAMTERRASSKSSTRVVRAELLRLAFSTVALRRFSRPKRAFSYPH